MHLHIVRNPSIHSGKLERFLGATQVDQISKSMNGPHNKWYGPPIAVTLVPGRVMATKDGDFVGRLGTNGFFGLIERQFETARRRFRAWVKGTKTTLNAGFTSLGDLIAEASAGKQRRFQFNKAGSTGVVQVTNSLWRLGNQPPAGTAPGAAPGGTAQTDATTGGFPFANPSGGDTQFFTSGFVTCEDAGNTLLLYDLIFGVAKTMNSSATESVTGVPTRYQSSTGGAADSAEGNFLFVQVGGTALAATAHNWTVCQYRNQAGTDAQTLPSLTGNSSAIVDRLDHPVGQWFAPLASGDTGVMDLHQMQCSAAVATGVIWFMIGHPIAWMPVPVANLICPTDGIRGAFQLCRIFDDACLAFLEVLKPSTSATTYTGEFISVAG